MKPNLWLRITAPAILIGLALLGACLAGAWYIHRLQANLSAVLTHNVRSLQAAQELEIRVRQMRFHNVVYLVEPTRERLDKLEQDEWHFQEALEVVRQLATTEDQIACVHAIEDQYAQYHKQQVELRQRVVTRHEAVPLIEQLDPKPLHLVVDPCETLLDINRKRMNDVAAESQTAGQRGSLALFLLGLAGPISGLVMGYGVTRGLSRSIYRLSVRVQDMAQHLGSDHRPPARPMLATRPRHENEVAAVSLVADGDLHNLDRQLEHIVRRVEVVGARLQQQQRELIRAEQLSAVGQLAASVAH